LLPLVNNIAVAAHAQVSTRGGMVRIALDEVYQGQRVRSLEHPVPLRLGEGGDDAWNRLARLPDHSSLLGTAAPDLRAKAQLALREYGDAPSPITLLRTFRLLVSILDPSELPQVLRVNLTAWTSSQFPDATLHAVKVDPYLAFRLRLPQMATGMVTYPELAIPKVFTEPRFQSMEGLVSSQALIGAAPFLQPLVLATAPIIHSIIAPRSRSGRSDGAY
jgi:hypothetical protein